MRIARRLLLYSVLAAVLLFKAWAWGEVYAPLGILDTFYPWRHYAVQEHTSRYVDYEGFAQRDAVLAALPQDAFMHAAFREGRLPLWNPDVLCGTPFAAYYRTVWYPPRALLLWAFDPVTGSVLSVFLHLVVAGLAMAWLLGRLGLRDAPAELGGMFWMLAGYSTAWIEIYYVPIACALLPLLLGAIDRFVCRRDAASFALGAVSMGLLFVGCHWQFAVYGAALASAWMVYRMWDGEGKGRWLWLPALWGAAIAVGAVQIAPTLQLAALSDRPPMPALASVNDQCRLLPEQLLTLVVPELFGSQAAGFFWSRINSPLQNVAELTIYIGIFPLLLVFAAPRSGTPAWRFFAGAAMGALLLSTGSWLFTLVWHVLPLVRFFTPVRMLWVVSFCLCVLAACGLQRVLDTRRLPGGMPGALGLLATAVAAECAAFVSFAPGGTWFDETLAAHIRSGSFPLPNYAAAADFARALLGAFDAHYRAESLPFVGPLLLSAAAVALAWAVGRRVVSNRFVVVVVGLLTAVDLLGFGLRANATAPRAALYPSTETTTLLARLPREYRVGGVGRMCMPEVLLAFGIADIGAYESLAPGRMRRLMATINGEAETFMLSSLYRGTHLTQGLADLLGLRLLYTNPKDAMPPWTRPVHTRDMTVAENPTALPRVFFVPAHAVLAGPDEVRSHMLAPTFDPRAAVLLEAPPVRAPAGTPDTEGERGTTHITMGRPRPERVEVALRLPRPGWVVLSESAYPGWRATLDGVEAPIEVAYATFQAVAVPSGAHRLDFVFDPPLQRWGLAASLVSVLGLGAAAFLSLWRSAHR